MCVCVRESVCVSVYLCVMWVCLILTGLFVFLPLHNKLQYCGVLISCSLVQSFSISHSNFINFPTFIWFFVSLSLTHSLFISITQTRSLILSLPDTYSLSHVCLFFPLSFTIHNDFRLLWVKLRCDTRFQHAFTACSCVFKVITMVWANQRNSFENTTAACSKRTLKTTVATQLKLTYFKYFCTLTYL